MLQTPLPSEKVIRRLLIYKIQREWPEWKALIAQNKSAQREYRVFFEGNEGFEVPQPIHFRRILKGAFYRLLQQQLEAFHTTLPPAQKIQLPVPNATWLRAFMAADHDRQKRGNYSRQYTLNLLCRYIGFEDYAAFEQVYQLYYQLLEITWAFKDIFHDRAGNYGQINHFIEKYRQNILPLLPTAWQANLPDQLPTTPSNLPLHKPMTEWSVQELFAQATLLAEPLEWMHTVIYQDRSAHETAEQYIPQRPTWQRPVWLISGLLLLASLVGLLVWQAQRLPTLTQADFDQIQLQVIAKDQSKAGHATVQVRYDARNIGGDGLIKKLGLVLQANSPTSQQRLNQAINTVLLSYERIGLHLISIQSNDEKLRKTIPLYLSAKDWVAYARSNKSKVVGGIDWYSKGIQKEQAIKQGTLRFPRYFIPPAAQRYFFTTYKLAKPLSISMGDFILECRLKTEADSLLNATCLGPDIGVRTQTNEYLHFNLLSKGCSRWTTTPYRTKEMKYQWNQANLERKKLIRPKQILTQWNTMKIVSNQGQYRYFFNNEQVYAYQAPVIQGSMDEIIVSFKGLGLIDYVKLWDGVGKLVYEEDFEEKL